MPYYKRGTAARRLRQEAEQNSSLAKADPHGLAPGFYKVRIGDHWRVARWRPQYDRWEQSTGNAWDPYHWDEIGDKVA